MRNNSVRRATFVLLLMSAVAACAREDADEALERLKNVEVFAFGGIGYAGVTSKGELDFKVLFAKPRTTALAALEKLYATGNAQGRAYALSGIRKLDRKRFKELLVSARASTDEVQVMRGCIVSHEPFGDVARQIAAGNFDLDR